MNITPSIFKAYDIRGLFPEQINQEVAQVLGQALVQILACEQVIIGRDMRLSSDEIFKGLALGIMAAGAKVIDIGLVTTDCVYYAAGKLNQPGIMITASHNPKEWNGLKIAKAGAYPFGDEEIKNLSQIAATMEIIKTEYQVEKISHYDVLPEYLNNIFSFIDKSKIKPLKIVADAGNGMAGKFIPLLFKDLPCELIPLYFELDGSFPNHPASPIEYKNLIDLQHKIQETQADLGMAFDGDADRVFFIDADGKVVDGGILGLLVAENFLQKHPNEKIIYDLRCSRAVPETIIANGGQALISRVGHSFIKKQMAETNAIFAEEFSGHYYYRDNYRADSAMITVLIILEILSTANLPLSKLVQKSSKYFQIEETNSTVADKEKVIASIKEKYHDGHMTELDGLTIEYADWWFNIRGSNTEPVLRLNLEAATAVDAEAKKAELLNLIRA